jgi:hypothetical protein
MRAMWRRLLVLVAVAALAASVGAATGQAGPTDPTTGLVDVSHQVAALTNRLSVLQAKDETAKTGTLTEEAQCGFGPPSQLFLPWADSDLYSLAPAGDLSTTSGWTLQDVTVSADHDPTSGSAASLVLGDGDSQAITPVMCVNLANPTLRFFIAHSGGTGRSTLEVTAVYEGVDGNAHTLSLAKLSPGPGWQPSPVIPIGVDVLSVVSASGTTPVSFSFTAHGLGRNETYSVDGVYVDPRMGG